MDSANTALKLVKEKESDLIFIDFVLPGKDGIRVCKEIKAINKNAKIVFMTVNTDVDPIFKELEIVKIYLK